MADNEKSKLGGIAALITAVAGLAGALAIFVPGSSSSTETPKDPAKTETTAAASNDFCSALDQCIAAIPKNFETIKGIQYEDPETDDSEQKNFHSKVNLPNSISCNISQVYLKDGGDLFYSFESVLIESKKLSEADIKYQQTLTRLNECLPQYVSSNEGKDESEGILKSAAYRLNKAEVLVELFVDEDGLYTTQLWVQPY